VHREKGRKLKFFFTSKNLPNPFILSAVMAWVVRFWRRDSNFFWKKPLRTSDPCVNSSSRPKRAGCERRSWLPRGDRPSIGSRMGSLPSRTRATTAWVGEETLKCALRACQVRRVADSLGNRVTKQILATPNPF